MDRLAILVDAGYFFAAGGKAAFNIHRRHELDFPDPQKCIGEIIDQCKQVAGNDNLLRVYWYDALTGSTPTATQSIIGHLHGTKLRLGVVNRTGEQKGVDSLIVTDLIDLARNRGVADVVLIAGDEDLRVAVQVAQTYGVRVHILAAGDYRQNVSASLQMEADSVFALSGEWFKKHLSLAVVASPHTLLAVDPSQGALSVEDAAEQTILGILGNIDQNKIDSLYKHFQVDTIVPSEYDRRLIACTARLVGRALTGDEKRRIRGVFVNQIRTRRGSL